MAKQKTKLVKHRKNAVVEHCFCLFTAAAFLISGISGVYHGSVLVGGTRRTLGTPVFGEEALTVSMAYIGCASLSILWLCRHRLWLPKAISVVVTGNIIIAVLVFNQSWLT